MSLETVDKPMQRLFREPLVHFAAIGLVVFLAYGFVVPAQRAQGTDIVITAQDGDRLKSQFHQTWQRDPTPEELRGLVDSFVHQEILYREAKRLGLDQNDQVIRVRLGQKLDYLLSNSAALPAPTEEELRQFYDTNKANYAAPGTIRFEQVFLGDAPQADIESAVTALRGGADPAGLGLPGMLPAEMPASTPAHVDKTFGAGFYQSLLALPLGEWAGPVTTAYGKHLVRVVSSIAGKTPPFEDIRSQVSADWHKQALDRAAAAGFEALKAQYRIDLSQVQGLN